MFNVFDLPLRIIYRLKILILTRIHSKGVIALPYDVLHHLYDGLMQKTEAATFWLIVVEEIGCWMIEELLTKKTSVDG